MIELRNRIKEHFGYSKKETKELLVTAIVGTFVFGFNDPFEELIISQWIFWFAFTFVVVAVALYIRTAVQKIWALGVGYRVEYKMWNYGLGASLLITVLTGGHWPLLLPGGAQFHVNVKHRLGAFRYGLNYATCGWIAAGGALANILFGMILQFIFFQLLGMELLMIDHIITVNFLIAVYTMLPIPPMDGLMLYFGTRMGYALVAGVIIAYVVLFLLNIYSLIFALILGVIVYGAYYFIFEKEGW